MKNIDYGDICTNCSLSKLMCIARKQSKEIKNKLQKLSKSISQDIQDLEDAEID